MRRALFLLPLALLASAAASQVRLPVIVSLGRQQPQPPTAVQPIDVLRADFAAQAGGTTVYFIAGGAQLGPQATTLIAAQAAWLRRHPEVTARIDGHGDTGDTRDHALAVGARRAEAVREYLVLLGVPAAQVSAMSWGKERPGAPRAVTVIR